MTEASRKDEPELSQDGNQRDHADGRPPPENPPAGVVAVLANEAEADGSIRIGLLALDPQLRAYSAPSEALAALEERTPALIVLDAANPDLDVAAFVRDATSGPRPSRTPVLVLMDGAISPANRFGEEVDVRHYLCRPFPADALRAYGAALLSRGTPASLRARRPTRSEAQPLHRDAARVVRVALERVRAGETPDVAGARPVAEQIHTDLLRSNALVLRALEPHGPYDLAAHCVNVAIIGGKLAMGLALGLDETLDVVHAGLLHDLGMARLPQTLLTKEGGLTTEEYAEVRRHPEYGAEVVGALGKRYEWLRQGILQEHERASGQGYPRGLEAEEIDPLGQILGVADVFEALTHPRTYRSPFTAFEALQQVVGMQEEYFPRLLVNALVNEISSFPLDSYVQLDTGEIAQVVRTNPENLMRPEVAVLWDADWKSYAEPRRIDLADDSSVSIARSLYEGELPIT